MQRETDTKQTRCEGFKVRLSPKENSRTAYKKIQKENTNIMNTIKTLALVVSALTIGAITTMCSATGVHAPKARVMILFLVSH